MKRFVIRITIRAIDMSIAGFILSFNFSEMDTRKTADERESKSMNGTKCVGRREVPRRNMIGTRWKSNKPLPDLYSLLKRKKMKFVN